MIYMAKISGFELCKIGYTVAPDEKLKMISTYCPFDIDIFETREGTHRQEFILHHHVQAFFVRREWFKYNETVVNIFRNNPLLPVDKPKLWRRMRDTEMLSTRNGERGVPGAAMFAGANQ